MFWLVFKEFWDLIMDLLIVIGSAVVIVAFGAHINDWTPERLHWVLVGYGIMVAFTYWRVPKFMTAMNEIAETERCCRKFR